MNLTELANLYSSDKGTMYKCAHGYTKHYEKFFQPYKGKKNFSILEIGLNRDDCRSVPSLQIYREYFGDNASIYGFDIRPEFRAFEANGFTIWIGDQSDTADLDQCVNASFDIVVDDGSHASSHQQISLRELWDTVKSGGLYVIEDLHWQPFAEPCASTRELAEAWMAGELATGDFLTPSWLKQFAQEVKALHLLPSESLLHSPEVTDKALLIIEKK